VVCPSFTFCGTVHAIKMLGAKPVFCDIGADTLTLNTRLAVRSAGTRTKAFIGVDVYGICCDYASIVYDAAYCGILALFDSAPAFGSLVNGKPTGSFGDAQIFSFHATKPFSTMEGGALCSNNAELFERARRIRDFGQDYDRNCTHVGLNGKMMEVCALVGLEQLKTWNEVSVRRRELGTKYRNTLSAIKGVSVVNKPEGHWPIWTYMPILVERRDEVLTALRGKGIEARTYYQACHLMRPYANGKSLPVTERVASQVIALPLLPDMTVEEMEYVCEALEGSMK
jgi:dTDP-4-amino-4,6-dideoxy-D-glucose transaminase